MTTRNLSIAIIAALLFSGSMKAQDNPQKFTLQQCLDFAVNNSYAVRRSNLDIREADYQKQEALAGVLPQVNASGSIDNNLAIAKVILPGEIVGQPGTTIAAEMGTKYVLDASARVEQVVFSSSLFTGIKIAKNSLELQKLRATMTGEELIFNVSYAYYDILNSVQELENISYMIGRQDSLYALTKRQVEESITREVDLNRLKVNLSNLRVRSENIQNAIAQQKRYLQILIGMSIEESIELDGSEINSTAQAVQTPPLQSHTELEILAKQKDILDLEIRQIKSEYLPTLSFVASGGYQFQAENLRLSKEPWFNSFLIGARLSIPVFDGFGKRSQVRQKRMQLQRLDTDIQEASQNIDMSYRNAQQQLGVSRKSVSAQNENLQLAEKVYSQTLLLYQEGMAGMTDLLETETSLSEAKTTYTAELIRYKKTEIDLLKAGGRLEELITKKVK
ncbi:MAG: TolC family protein [Prevotellaceae bacterium]|jgi:outer membrane protein TolC|nr:TolC family protein [Prevotellaceae bacterium]